MQALILLVVVLSLASGSKLKLQPYEYRANPQPVQIQSINENTGEHAYSYAGGPSAKEEIKDIYGTVRGSYSYIDANNILQSVFYVADDEGFRVIATNLPGHDYSTAKQTPALLILNPQESDQAKLNRRKRSVLDSVGEENARSDKDAIKGQSKLDDITQPELPPLLKPVGLLDDSYQSKIPPARLTPLLAATSNLRNTAEYYVPSYHENRILLHHKYGIEGANPKSVVRIDVAPHVVEATPTILKNLSPPHRNFAASNDLPPRESMGDSSATKTTDDKPIESKPNIRETVGVAPFYYWYPFIPLETEDSLPEIKDLKLPYRVPLFYIDTKSK